ncbi:hypothetical protein KDW_60360 [Dictyobacter vulcani]|uniref:AB hydrolase-1 domain-containing protein n=1 Tax=Dictyobacter vulcani TaxID=2607529 RepID=A0A5J4KR78_9CHLR|nr:hypothetical protein KDW_60360 [Dictyobacter vulcani]
MECIVRNIPVYYETYGTGTPIIMIHGYTPDHRLMTGCMEPVFAQRPGWQRIYLDLPGMGRTPASDQIQGIDDMLDLVVAFIDAVIPGQPFLIAGESYGGNLSRGVVQRKFAQFSKLAQPFTRPVLIFTGRQDTVVGYRDAWNILEQYPRGTFAVLDRAGHNGHIEQSQLFNAMIHEWLDRVEETL